jgi:hypothetical protein
MSKQRLDLDDLLEQKQKIYVQNNALKSNLFMVIEMKDKNGKNRGLSVPPVEFPVCVSDQFSSDSIRECSDLRNALQKQVLVLVDPDEAVERLKHPDAKEVMQAYQVSAYSDTAPKNAVRDSLERLKNTSGTPAPVEARDILSRNKESEDDKVSIRVRGAIASFLSKEKTSKDTLTQLKKLKPTLSENDLTYILTQCKGEVTIREFAEEVLASQANGG